MAAALVFDTSPRMAYRQDNQTRLEVAQSTAHWLLGQLPAESEVAVLESEQPAGDFAVDLGAAEQRIAQLKPAATATPLPESIAKALPLVRKKEEQRKEIYLFTDLSRGAWPTDVSGRLKALLEDAGDVAVYVIDVGVAEPHDFSLGDVRVSPEVLAKNGQVQIETEAIRIGPEEERGVAIYVIDTKGVPQPALKRRSTGGQASRRPSISHSPAKTSARIKATSASKAKTISRPTTRAISHSTCGRRSVCSSPRRSQPIDMLYSSPRRSRPTLCAKAAGHGSNAKRSRSTSFSIAIWKATPPFACSIRRPSIRPCGSGWEATSSKEAASPSGSAATPQPIDTFNDPAALALLPGKPFQRHHAPETSVILAPRDLQHPLLARFRPLGGSVPWQSFPIWEYWQLTDVDKNSNVVIPYSDGRPALVERLVDRGRVLMMTTPISDTASDPNAWNQLATGFKPWPFVMLSNESLLYLVGSGEERLNYLVGQRAALRLEEAQTQSVFALSAPDGNEAATLTADQINHLVSVPATSAAGNYRIRAGGTEGGVDRGFSANTPLAATELERLKPEDLDALLGAGRYRLTHGRDEIDRSVTVGRVGRELFPLLIVLVAIALGLEHLLANRFYRRVDLPPLRQSHLTKPNAPLAETKSPPLQEVGASDT